VTVVLVLAGTLAVSRWSQQRVPDSLVSPLESIPLRIGGWSGAAAPKLPESVESRLLATEYLARVYQRENRSMGMLVTYYAQQRAGESMHSPKNCLPGAGWEAWDYRTVSVPVGPRREVVNLYSVQKNGERMLVLYWYQSRSRVIAGEYTGKAYLVWDALVDGRTGGALVRLNMPHAEGALEDQLRFASLLIPAVQQCLGGTAY
jgi:EpsI family protein